MVSSSYTGARVLYRLHPEARDRAISIVTNLSDTLKDRTLKVHLPLGTHSFQSL